MTVMKMLTVLKKVVPTRVSVKMATAKMVLVLRVPIVLISINAGMG